ncbi:MAG: DUF4232 domain-containing protein [Actinomycetales bacterium]|nr:DUF4232 domain-containing protein [Actinomycetales bacterium]
MRTAPTRRGLALAGSAAALVLVLAGCSAGASAGSSSPTTAAGGTSSGASSTPGPTPTESTSPSPSATPSAGPTEAGPSPTTTSLRSTRCTAGHLEASLTSGEGGAAGSILPYLVLTNTGTERCTLQGWPGVSLVGDGDGTQLGAAGDFDRSSPHGTVTLDPGGSAHAPLKIAQAANYDAATCDPQTADGLRVYPPGETHSLFVASTDLTACRSDSVHLITVQALLPGAS